MSKYTTQYLEHVIDIMQRIDKTQGDKIDEAAKKIADIILSGGSMFLFGPGHAGIFTQDMYHRAGGFVLAVPWQDGWHNRRQRPHYRQNRDR